MNTVALAFGAIGVVLIPKERHLVQLNDKEIVGVSDVLEKYDTEVSEIGR